MAKLFILIRRKGSKTFLGAIPAKRSATPAKLKRMIKTRLRGGLSARIVTEAQLKRIISRQRPRITRRRKSRRSGSRKRKR